MTKRGSYDPLGSFTDYYGTFKYSFLVKPLLCRTSNGPEEFQHLSLSWNSDRKYAGILMGIQE